jgi:ArsR family transcriptional regulator, arsenate/arsenite/antimonite-responsive transcriptional repressor
MAKSEAEIQQEALDAMFRALSHPSRRQILFVLLFRGGQMTAGQIAERFSCTWPTTTRHMRVLETAGLIHVEKRGRERIYILDRERLLSVLGDWLQWFKEKSHLISTPIGTTFL